MILYGGGIVSLFSKDLVLVKENWLNAWSIETGGNYLYLSSRPPESKIYIFDINGIYQGYVGNLFGKKDNKHGAFSTPSSIVYQNPYLFVADTGNNRVEKFSISARASAKPVGTGLAKTAGCSIYGIIN